MVTLGLHNSQILLQKILIDQIFEVQWNFNFMGIGKLSNETNDLMKMKAILWHSYSESERMSIRFAKNASQTGSLFDFTNRIKVFVI